jgi:hypothetical protein
MAFRLGSSYEKNLKLVEEHSYLANNNGDYIYSIQLKQEKLQLQKSLPFMPHLMQLYLLG